MYKSKYKTLVYCSQYRKRGLTSRALFLFPYSLICACSLAALGVGGGERLQSPIVIFRVQRSLEILWLKTCQSKRCLIFVIKIQNADSIEGFEECLQDVLCIVGEGFKIKLKSEQSDKVAVREIFVGSTICTFLNVNFQQRRTQMTSVYSCLSDFIIYNGHQQSLEGQFRIVCLSFGSI